MTLSLLECMSCSMIQIIIWAATWENQQCGFWPGLTQTRLYSHWRWLEAWNFGFSKKRYCAVQVLNTKALISFAVALYSTLPYTLPFTLYLIPYPTLYPKPYPSLPYSLPYPTPYPIPTLLYLTLPYPTMCLWLSHLQLSYAVMRQLLFNHWVCSSPR